MSEYFTPLIVGNNITELPKSTLPASATDNAGHYPFFCSSAEVKATSTWLQEKPTVLMGTGGMASVNYGEDRFAYSTDTWGFRSNNAKLDTKFLFRKIQQHLPRIDYAGFEGSGLRHLRKDYVKKLKINVPTPTVQSRIVDIVDGFDRAIEKTEALIAKYQQIKAGLMHDLFTCGITADGKLRPPCEQTPELYQETPIGWMPKEWEPINLGKYIEFNLYGPRFDAGDYDENGNVKTIRGTDFSKDGEIKYSQVPIASLPNQKMYRHILKAGDLVVVTTADCGLTAVFEEQDFPFIPSAYAVKYRFANSVNPYFIKYFMQTNMAKRQINKYVRQGTLGNLPGSDLLRFFLALPQLCEQTAIVQRLETIQKKITLEQQAVDKLAQQKLGLMHDLLTGRVRIKSAETEIVPT